MTVNGRCGASMKMMKLLEDRCGWSMRTADMIAVQSMLSRNTVMTTLTDEEFAVTRGGKRKWNVSEQVRIDASEYK